MVTKTEHVVYEEGCEEAHSRIAVLVQVIRRYFPEDSICFTKCLVQRSTATQGTAKPRVLQLPVDMPCTSGESCPSQVPDD